VCACMRVCVCVRACMRVCVRRIAEALGREENACASTIPVHVKDKLPHLD